MRRYYKNMWHSVCNVMFWHMLGFWYCGHNDLLLVLAISSPLPDLHQHQRGQGWRHSFSYYYYSYYYYYSHYYYYYYQYYSFNVRYFRAYAGQTFSPWCHTSTSLGSLPSLALAPYPSYPHPTVLSKSSLACPWLCCPPLPSSYKRSLTLRYTNRLSVRLCGTCTK